MLLVGLMSRFGPVFGVIILYSCRAYFAKYLVDILLWACGVSFELQDMAIGRGLSMFDSTQVHAFGFDLIWIAVYRNIHNASGGWTAYCFGACYLSLLTTSTSRMTCR